MVEMGWTFGKRMDFIQSLILDSFMRTLQQYYEAPKIEGKAAKWCWKESHGLGLSALFMSSFPPWAPKENKLK